MYTQDQFESLSRNICKTNIYELHTDIKKDHLEIRLKTTPSHKEYFRYSGSITMQDLEESLQEKFQNLKNLQVFLSNSQNFSVDLVTGIIGLAIGISLPNGKTITTRIGQIKLKQDIFDHKKCLNNILYSCENLNIFNNDSFKNIVKEIANMIQVLFKKFQIYEGKDNDSHKENFYSFQNTFVRSKRQSSIYPSQKTIKIQKQFHERAKSINLKNERMERSRLFKQLDPLNQIKKQISLIKNQLQQSQQKKSQKFDQIQKEIQKIKQEISLYNLECFQKPIIGERKRSIRLKSVFSQENSPNSKHLQSGSQAFAQNFRKEYQDFSNAVVQKIQSLGKENELIQDKLKRVVQQLDIRLQQRLIKESIYEIDNRIIDKETPYFNEFELKGTQIEYKGEDSISTILLSRLKIAQIKKYSIKIVKSLVNNIQIGIMDSEYRKMRDCWTLPNFIIYVGWNSTIYQGPNDLLHKEGDAICQGDTITMRANVESGLIEWLVDGQVRAKVVWDKLKDKTINWVPMIRFYDHGDVISWVTNSMLRV